MRIYIEIYEAQEALFEKGASYGQCWRSYSWRKLQKHQKQLRLRLPVLPLHQPLYVRPQKLRPYPRLLPPLRHLQSLESLLWLATKRDRGKGERRGSGRKTARGQWNGEREERRGRTLWPKGVRLGRRNELPSTNGRLGIDAQPIWRRGRTSGNDSRGRNWQSTA